MSIELNVAASEGKLKDVKTLYNPDEEINIAMCMAAQDGYLEILEYLVTQSEKSTLEIMYKGKSISDYKWGLEKSLFYASQNNHIGVVEFLIGKEAHKERRDINRTAMHAAASCGNNEILEKLLDTGLDVDVTDSDGCTPLSEAVGSKQVETVRLLISKSADPLKDDNFGVSPWDMAVDSGNVEIKKIINNSFPEERRIPGL